MGWRGTSTGSALGRPVDVCRQWAGQRRPRPAGLQRRRH